MGSLYFHRETVCTWGRICVGPFCDKQLKQENPTVLRLYVPTSGQGNITETNIDRHEFGEMNGIKVKNEWMDALNMCSLLNQHQHSKNTHSVCSRVCARTICCSSPAHWKDLGRRGRRLEGHLRQHMWLQSSLRAGWDRGQPRLFGVREFREARRKRRCVCVQMKQIMQCGSVYASFSLRLYAKLSMACSDSSSSHPQSHLALRKRGVYFDVSCDSECLQSVGDVAISHDLGLNRWMAAGFCQACCLLLLLFLLLFSFFLSLNWTADGTSAWLVAMEIWRADCMSAGSVRFTVCFHACVCVTVGHWGLQQLLSSQYFAVTCNTQQVRLPEWLWIQRFKSFLKLQKKTSVCQEQKITFIKLLLHFVLFFFNTL